MRYTDYAGNQNNGGTGTGIEIDFTNANIPIFSLFSLENGDNLLEIVVKVTEVFDAGVNMSLGFPANNSEIAPQNKINLQKLGTYKFYPYRETVVAETLTAYFSGASSSGKGKIFITQ